jgi:small subunit ribosomal protein S1
MRLPPAPTPSARVVPGKVTKLVPFGAFVRVAEGIEGLVHISSCRQHVELARAGRLGRRDGVFVKVTTSTSSVAASPSPPKQANEGVDPEGTGVF